MGAWREEDINPICSFTTFRCYWAKEHPKLIIRRSSKDICGLCYKFEMEDRYNNRKHTVDDDDDDEGIEEEAEEEEDKEGDAVEEDVDTEAMEEENEEEAQVEDNADEEEQEEDDEDKEDEDGYTAPEKKRIEHVSMLRQHINEAASMRALVRKLVAEAKKCTQDQVHQREMCITLIVDYCQNLSMPSFNKDQPGETYFFVPMNVYCLGIVDCNSPKDHLYAYMYTEKEGGKGGNNVASIIMKHLEQQGYLDGVTRLKLTIIMDNCTGQNKCNRVVGLAPYLVDKGYFVDVGFIFLVVGHTKNSADRLFNILKIGY